MQRRFWYICLITGFALLLNPIDLMQLQFLHAGVGDAILLTFNDNKGHVRNILIDGGTAETYAYKDKKDQLTYGAFGELVEHIRSTEQKIDLLILTHVDNDHIGGLTAWFEEDKTATDLIGRVLFNSGKLIQQYFEQSDILENHLSLTPTYLGTDTGINEGVTFEGVISEAKIWQESIVKQGQTIDFYDVQLKILSPNDEALTKLLGKWTKIAPESLTAHAKDYKKTLKDHVSGDKFIKDYTEHNGSSIAFILNYKGEDVLFLADAHPDKVAEGLKTFGYSAENKLECSIIKIAHHGSKYNTSPELLQLIDAPVYVISSDGSESSPHKQCLARLIEVKQSLSLYFNYPELAEAIFQEQDFIDYPGLKILPADHQFTIGK